jgi:hypothetical protein
MQKNVKSNAVNCHKPFQYTEELAEGKGPTKWPAACNREGRRATKMKTGLTYDPIAAEFLMRELRADFKTAMQRFKARDRYRRIKKAKTPKE